MLISIFPVNDCPRREGQRRVPIEEHDSARVIQLIHLEQNISAHRTGDARRAYFVEIGDLGDIAQVDNGKVLHLLRNGVQRLVHFHTLWIPVVSESDDDDAILFGFDGFVDVPATWEMGEEVRHGKGEKEVERRVAVRLENRIELTLQSRENTRRILLQ